MKAIVTVIGRDRVGIIAAICTALAESSVNILDISQTILQEYFTMIMVVDIKQCTLDFSALSEKLAAVGDELGLSVRIQREDIFDAMHRI